ncbi:uncharacterized protein LOC128239803 [Mya arenaria]|uniref:uncharacterized protein LOC128239803 n=1 Tax=Mya arenaria TaxID=6604 RepID=UPI0022E70C29|nr:uncharacterized protein LOC128239803 [Mya arenaria]
MTCRGYQKYGIFQKKLRKRKTSPPSSMSYFLKMCRVVLFIVLTLLLLSCGILHKLYFLTLLNNLSEKLHAPVHSDLSKVENKKSQAISILVCIAFVEFCTSLVTLWRVVFQDQKTNWTRQHLVTAIQQAVSTIGEVYLIIYALPLLGSLRACLVVTVLPLMSSICKFVSTIGRLRVKRCIRKGSLLKLCVAGFPVLALAGSVFLFMNGLIPFDRDLHLKWALPTL